MSLSQVMAIIIQFEPSAYRAFKHYYHRSVGVYLRWVFPQLMSYNRLLELMAEVSLPLSASLWSRKGQCSGISFIDSRPIAVGHSRRISSHPIWAKTAERGKNSVGSMISNLISSIMMKGNC